jgi:hypothetical protein
LRGNNDRWPGRYEARILSHYKKTVTALHCADFTRIWAVPPEWEEASHPGTHKKLKLYRVHRLSPKFIYPE